MRIKGTTTEKRIAGGELITTNNRMELKGLIEALKILSIPCKITVTSDSRYVVDGISKWMKKWKKHGWKRKQEHLMVDIANVDMWRELDTLLAKHEVEMQWTKGHAGHPENEWCDAAAGQQTVLMNETK
jgi:ribonuclease HI